MKSILVLQYKLGIIEITIDIVKLIAEYRNHYKNCQINGSHIFTNKISVKNYCGYHNSLQHRVNIEVILYVFTSWSSIFSRLHFCIPSACSAMQIRFLNGKILISRPLIIIIITSIIKFLWARAINRNDHYTLALT